MRRVDAATRRGAFSIMDAAALIRDFAAPHRAKQAWWRLLAMGEAALPAVQAAMDDANADVRLHCVRFLDHFPTPDFVEDLARLARDPDARVRVMAVHALACDHCKPDKCAPSTSLTLPLALDLARNDPDPLVRAMAVGLLGKAVHQARAAVDMLRELHAHDLSPAVRKKAAWYLPGGPIYTRTAPKPARVKRAA